MEKINEKNVCDLLDGVDIIIDCLDNLQTRHLLNDIALKMNIPLVYKNRLKINNQYNNFLK
jgi:adenylyltransferase/sulfurtransferase